MEESGTVLVQSIKTGCTNFDVDSDALCCIVDEASAPRFEYRFWLTNFLVQTHISVEQSGTVLVQSIKIG